MQPSPKPNNGYVPDEQTAISIAVAVWTPLYGAKQIASEKPYQATLNNGVWTVTSAIPPRTKYVQYSVVEISQDTGCVLRVDRDSITF